MSYLAAMLLLYMDAYPAFQCLANMLHSHYFLSFLRMDMGQIRIRFAVYDVFFEENMCPASPSLIAGLSNPAPPFHSPSLYRRFKELDIFPDIYLLNWFVSRLARHHSFYFAGF